MATKNDFIAQRTATMTVTAGAITRTLQVSQSANPAGMTAASTRTWAVSEVYEGVTIEQVWSDYIEYDGKSKVPATITDFINSMDVGDYRNIPGYKGYAYNYAYVVANHDKLCPAPWRVPTANDLRNLAIAFGSTGHRHEGVDNTDQLKEVIKKFEDIGFEYSGRFNPTNNQFQYEVNVGYIYSKDQAQNGDATKSNHLLIKNRGQNNTWSVIPWNEYHTSQQRNFGLPVRCVKGPEVNVKEAIFETGASLRGWGVAGAGQEGLTIDPNGISQGKPCVSYSHVLNTLFNLNKISEWSLETKVTIQNGILAFNVYISDVTRLSNIDISIHSSADDFLVFAGGGINSADWNFLTNGWNRVEKDLSSMLVRGNPDFSAINAVHFHFHATNPLTVKLDNIRFYEK
jgi:uncharacterized protein (TIGR02145 family)